MKRYLLSLIILPFPLRLNRIIVAGSRLIVGTFVIFNCSLGISPADAYMSTPDGSYVIPSLTISGGGATNLSSGGASPYTLQVMTGQTVIGLSTNAPYNAQLGGIYALSGAGESMIAGGRLEIATERLPDGQVGVPYITTLEARNGTPRYAWSAPGGLPPGLSLNNRGTLEGIPTASGIYDVRIRVEDSDATVSEESFTINILNAGVAGPQLRLTALLQGYYNSATNTSRLAVISVEAWTGTAPDRLTRLEGIATINMRDTGFGFNGFMLPGGSDPMHDYIAPGNYYLVVRHQLGSFKGNHLPVITSRAINLPDAGQTVNLADTATDAFVPVYTPDGLVSALKTVTRAAGGTRLALRAGMLNDDKIIDVGDYSVWRGAVTPAGTIDPTSANSVRSDINGDGIIDVGDYSLWRGTVYDFAPSNVPQTENHIYVP